MISLKHIFLVICLITLSQSVRGFPGRKNQERKDDSIPNPSQVALVARYVVHASEWTSIGTVSTNSDIKGYPFVGLKSMADGPTENGTGVPYMLMTDMDVSMIDLNHDNRCTLFVTLAQGDFCKTMGYDPQDPRCARVMLTGSVEKLEKGSSEELFAKNALYSRHPPMKYWPEDHHFFFVKLNIIQVGVLDRFGGISYVTPQDYYSADPNGKTHQLMDRQARAREVEAIQIIF